MKATIADLLNLASFQGAQVRAGKNHTGRFVRGFTSNPEEPCTGMIYVAEDDSGNLNALLQNHPEAAGFLIPKTSACKVKGNLPVIAVENCSLCRDEWMKLEPEEDLSVSFYKDLSRYAGDEKKLLARVKELLKCEVTLNREAEPVKEEMIRETVLTDSETCVLAADAEQADPYALSSAARALEGIDAAKSHVITAARKEVAHLIYEGEWSLAKLVAAEKQIPLSEDALIWLLCGNGGANVRTWIASIREFCHSFGTVYLLEQVGSDLILVLEKNGSYRDQKRHMQSLAEYCKRSSMPLTLVSGLSFDCIYSAEQMRGMLERTKDVLTAIFPRREFFERQDVFFAEECRKLYLQGGSEIERYRCGIDALLKETDPDMLETLEAYYLDFNMSIPDTASSLFLHRNTVKYRLQRAEDVLGLDFSNAVNLRRLTVLLAVARLIK